MLISRVPRSLTPTRYLLSPRTFSNIPVVDIAALVSGEQNTEAKAAVADQLHRACRDVGFFYVKNHGVPEGVYKGVLQHARAWFALPEATKQELRLSPSTHFRGYQRLGANVTRYDGGFQRDWHEAIDLYKEPVFRDPPGAHNSPVHGLNQWPQQLPEFESSLRAYVDSMLQLGSKLMRGIAMGLGLPERCFEHAHQGGTTAATSYWVVRVIHYPPLADAERSEQDAAAASRQVLQPPVAPAAADLGAPQPSCSGPHIYSTSSRSAGSNGWHAHGKPPEGDDASSSSGESSGEDTSSSDDGSSDDSDDDGGGEHGPRPLGRAIRDRTTTNAATAGSRRRLHTEAAEGLARGAELRRSMQLSCGEHTDYGLLTLVNQEERVAALQVKNAQGQWITAPPIPGTFVCNIGDMLRVWTNGTYRPTPHRVINADPSASRVSIPFFYEPAFETIVAPLPQLCGDRPPICEPIRYGTHLESKVLSNFEL